MYGDGHVGQCGFILVAMMMWWMSILNILCILDPCSMSAYVIVSNTNNNNVEIIINEMIKYHTSTSQNYTILHLITLTGR